MSVRVAPFVGVSARGRSGFCPPRRYFRAKGLAARRPSSNSHRTKARRQRIDALTLLRERGTAEVAVARATATASPRQTPRTTGLALRYPT